MKKVFKRNLSVLLVLAMLISACMVSEVEVYAGELSEENETELTQSIDGTEAEDSTDVDDQQTDSEETFVEEIARDSDINEYSTEETDESESEGTESQKIVSKEYELELAYDDYYTLTDLDSDLSDYAYVDIETEEDSVTSYQVSGGSVTSELDQDVATYDQETGRLIASGVGKATVILSNSPVTETNEESNEDISGQTGGNSEDIVLIHVTVKPATLTMMFVAGQSNAEGSTSSSSDTHPEDSILCEEGTVYSTYAPSSSSTAYNNTGLSNLGACTAENASSFVAGALSGSLDMNGEELAYPLNSLTESGNGKTGMDSGLAYYWHTKTGDKVWVVNAAYSATSISYWNPNDNGTCYNRALAVFDNAVKTAEAEEEAGHYQLKNRLLFWLQGEADATMSASDYRSAYQGMYRGFANAGLGTDYHGIVMVRAGSSTNTNDITMTGPRTAQYLMGNSNSDSNIYVVSNVNEQWVTDSGVENYFRNVYGSNLSYPLRSNTTLSGIPDTVSAVHADIHYSQVGHNENGLTAAETMYNIVYGKSQSSPTSICWYDADGTALQAGALEKIDENVDKTYVPVVDPLYFSKDIEVELDSPNLTYDEDTGVVSASSKGTGTLTAKAGNVSSSIVFSSDTLGTPALNKAEASAGKITVTWNSVDGASGYRIYRRADSDSGWIGIGTTEDTRYTDTDQIKIGTKYYYTVRAYRGDLSTAMSNTYKNTYWSYYDTTGVSAVALGILSTPQLTKASASDGTITVSWNAVSGADGYRVYRKTSGGDWNTIGSSDKPSYIDYSAEANVTYYYTVRAYKGSQEDAWENSYYVGYWSDYDSSGVSAKASEVIATPSLTKAFISNGAVTVTWKDVSGANGYRIYRKTSGGSWTTIGTSTSAEYTDNDNLGIGTTYYYTVRAYRGEYSVASENTYGAAYWSGYDSKGVSVKMTGDLSTPILISAKTTGGSNIVTWKEVTGAEGYRVYRRASNDSSWTAITNTTHTSYTDVDKLSIGTTYYYTIRAYQGVEETALANMYDYRYWSDYDASGVSVKTTAVLSTPFMVSAKTSGGSNIITWKEVTGADGYRIYRRPSSDNSWVAITSLTGVDTSYTDTDQLKIGTTYYYTVRAFKGDAETALENSYDSHYWSDYEAQGISVKAVSALTTPSLKKATASKGDITITWETVSGAEGYRVYRRPSGDSSWVAIANSTDSSFTDGDSLKIGTTYYYTVRAYKDDEELAMDNMYYTNYWSDYETTGVSAEAAGELETPSLKKATASKGDITVTWSLVDGADGYLIYRKPSGGDWESIANTNSDSYTDGDSLRIGTTYYYTVRAYKGDLDTALENKYYTHYWSDYVYTGISATATAELSTPVLIKASASTAQITVTWNEVSGADGYRVYRKTSGGSWNTIGTTASSTLSYTDTSYMEAFVTYYYTVRAYKGDYSEAENHTYLSHYWSDYNASGVSATAISVLTTPSLKSATKGSSGVDVTYGSVSGASGYRIYRKTSSGSWSTIGTSNTTTYTDTSSLSSGTTYYYTVRAYKGDYSLASDNAYDVNYWSGYDSTGLKYSTVADTAMYNKAQSYSSSTKYLILVNSTTNKVGIFTGSKGNWDMKYYWSCSTGKSSTPTKKGTFTIGSKGKSFSGSNYTCWYYSQFSGNYLFHSVLYKKGSMTTINDGRLGMNISHGCVRLAIDNAKWIYDNVPKGSTVVSY